MFSLLVLAAAVSVSVGPAVPCATTVDSVAVAGEELTAALKSARQHTSRAVVHYSPETPWRCIGGAVTELARAHFRHVTYDPPFPKR